MTIAHSKEMLVVRLANVRCQDEIILVFLVDVVHTEALPGRIRESSNHIVLYYFYAFGLVLLHLERVVFRVRDPIVIVDALICERRRRWYARYQALDRASHGIVIHR